MRRVMTAVAGAAAIGALAAGCGSGPASSTSMPYHAASAAGDGSVSGSSVLALRTLPGMSAKVLVGAGGRTLYLFGGDTAVRSRCSGACATAWPPYLATQAPKAGMGVNPALLGTIQRSDGTTQVTYNGHPLYYNLGDRDAGSHHGQAVKAYGAQWYVVGAGGNKIGTT